MNKEEHKSYSKIEQIDDSYKKPQNTPETSFDYSSVVNKQRVRARNRVMRTPPKVKLKPPEVKLNLGGSESLEEKVRRILFYFKTWTKYNINEIKDYLNTIEKKLNPSPEWLENAKTHQGYPRPGTYNGFVTKKEAHRILGLPYHYPDWMKYLKNLVNLWEISHARGGLLKEYRTTKEWYEKMELDFPASLEPEADIVITNRKDLERTGISENLEYKIKKDLKIEDELEEACHNWDKLNKLEKGHIKWLLDYNKELKKHPYYVLIIENIKDDETKQRTEN